MGHPIGSLFDLSEILGKVGGCGRFVSSGAALTPLRDDLDSRERRLEVVRGGAQEVLLRVHKVLLRLNSCSLLQQPAAAQHAGSMAGQRSEEHTSELQS